jgi:hypothetical protein
LNGRLKQAGSGSHAALLHGTLHEVDELRGAPLQVADLGGIRDRIFPLVPAHRQNEGYLVSEDVPHAIGMVLN